MKPCFTSFLAEGNTKIIPCFNKRKFITVHNFCIQNIVKRLILFSLTAGSYLRKGFHSSGPVGYRITGDSIRFPIRQLHNFVLSAPSTTPLKFGCVSFHPTFMPLNCRPVLHVYIFHLFAAVSSIRGYVEYDRNHYFNLLLLRAE